MKYIITAALVFFVSNEMNAQFSPRLFFNVSGGLMNYSGDLQQKSFTFKQSHSMYGIGATYQFWNNLSLTATYTHGEISADDKYGSPSHIPRNLNFFSNVSEGSVVLEASLFDVPGNAKFTPYVFEGLSVFHINPYTFDPSGNKVYLQPLGTEGQGLPQYPDKKPYKLLQVAIPIGIGVKYAISNNLMIGAEVCFRKAFTDYLDDVSGPVYADTAVIRASRGALAAKLSFRGDELNPPYHFNSTIIRGNPVNKDWFYSCLIKFSFSFDRGNIFNK